MIFAHRCYLEKGEFAIKHDVIRDRIGPGGNTGDPDHRWIYRTTSITELKSYKLDPKEVIGDYYGFRTRDDQILFHMIFQGINRAS